MLHSQTSDKSPRRLRWESSGVCVGEHKEAEAHTTLLVRQGAADSPGWQALGWRCPA